MSLALVCFSLGLHIPLHILQHGLYKVTLTLPTEVMNAVCKEAPPRGYSKFIAEAVIYFIEEQRHRALRERLITGYQARAGHDQALAEEWRPLEEEVWREYVEPVEEGE